MSTSDRDIPPASTRASTIHTGNRPNLVHNIHATYPTTRVETTEPKNLPLISLTASLRQRVESHGGETDVNTSISSGIASSHRAVLPTVIKGRSTATTPGPKNRTPHVSDFIARTTSSISPRATSDFEQPSSYFEAQPSSEPSSGTPRVKRPPWWRTPSGDA